MMMRILLAGAMLGLGATSLVAQSSPVRERALLMKEQGRAFYGTLNRMARGQDPYDQAKVDQAFAILAQTAPKLPALYASAKGEDPDAGYFANAKVWDNKADFDARLAKLKKDIEENQPKAKSLDGLKAAVGAVGETCNGCHEIYRTKKS